MSGEILGCEGMGGGRAPRIRYSIIRSDSIFMLEGNGVGWMAGCLALLAAAELQNAFEILEYWKCCLISPRHGSHL